VARLKKPIEITQSVEKELEIAKNKNRIKLDKDAVDIVIRMFAEDPNIKISTVAKEINVSEATIRYWKRHPLYLKRVEEIREETELAVKKIFEKETDTYVLKLENQHKKLKAIYEAVELTAIQAIRLANRAYSQLSVDNDAVKSCSKATQAGVHVHLKQGIDAISKLIPLNEQLLNLEIVKDYLEQEDDDCEDVEYEEVED
jgi:hypothetical protein